MHRMCTRFAGQLAGVINQIRAFMSERGIAERQGLRFRRDELPGILAKRTDALLPPILHMLAWQRPLDFTSAVGTLQRHPADQSMSLGRGPPSV
jgi:hypothetical protein